MAADRLLSIGQAAAFYPCAPSYIHQLLREKRISDAWDSDARAPKNSLRVSEVELVGVRRQARARGRGPLRRGRTSVAEVVLVLAESDRRLSEAEAKVLAEQLEASRRLEEERVARVRVEGEIERLKMQLSSVVSQRERLEDRRELLEHVVAQESGPQSAEDLL